MLQQIGGFIGMALADIVNLFRGRQAVPCLVDWDHSYIDPDNQLPDEFFDSLDDCCPDYEVDCCLATDTIGEAQGKE